MIKTNLKVLSILTLLFGGILSNKTYAAEGVVKAVTSAPAGTELRIYTYPYDVTITGAEPEGHAFKYLSNGPGTEITISAEGLSQVEIFGCQLSQLQIESAPDLYILKCYNNKIESLDVAGCPALAVLDCHNNLIERLDVSGSPLLETLNTGNNQLKSLILGQQENISELHCNDNPLSELNVTDCPKLNMFYFENCDLNDIDLSKCTKLDWVFAYNNNLKGTAMSDFIAKLPDVATNARIYIVDTRAANESNVCTMDDVRALAMKGWVSMDYLGGNESETDGLGKFYPGCDYVPTVSERTISLTTSRQAGDKITLYIKASANISISGVKEDGISGKETYTLTSPNVEIHGDVTAFECPDNDITSLSFSDLSLLTYIECQNNKIEKLDLEGARALSRLQANNNALTSLNVAGCASLVRIDCYANQLKGNGMKAFVNSLSESSNDPYLFIIDTKANGQSEGNVATTTDVKIAKEKGWDVRDYNGNANYGFGITYNGSEPTEPELPEQYFTITRTEKGHISFTVTFSDFYYEPIIEGGTLSGWNGSGLMINMTENTIKIYGDAISINTMFAVIEDIDVSHLPNLEELNVGLNDIKTLDLSGNPNLTTLSCECNLLTTLDVSSCPQIDYINCYGNNISGEGMTAMIISLPLRPINAPGTLIVYDQTYSYENNKCLKSDVIAARARNWETYELASDGTANLVVYDGFDPAGIEDVTVESTISYDNAASLISLSTPSAIEVFAASGRLMLKSENTSTLSTASLPAGIYVVRAGTNIIKIKK